ncbi:MAG: lipoyl(octanoyl) transferase LipB [Desulfuromonadaceae bacterium]|nr:lipoyl(octanoyl) transferase LipB [Desulfuromonadaceae bacterium]
MNGFFTLRPGRISYRAGLALQQQLLAHREAGTADFLILLEHPPVITLGSKVKEFRPLAPHDYFESRGIEVIRARRGGETTYHGPGQLIGYPIVGLDLVNRDLHRFLRLLEELLVKLLRRYGISAERLAGRTGVWVSGRKIASIGVGVRRWISWHGFALNVGGYLSPFGAIVPCGLTGVEMTSMAEHLGEEPSIEEVEGQVIHCFAEVFESIHLGEW